MLYGRYNTLMLIYTFYAHLSIFSDHQMVKKKLQRRNIQADDCARLQLWPESERAALTALDVAELFLDPESV